jgi:hypothetical protein
VARRAVGILLGIAVVLCVASLWFTAPHHRGDATSESSLACLDDRVCDSMSMPRCNDVVVDETLLQYGRWTVQGGPSLAAANSSADRSRSRLVWVERHDSLWCRPELHTASPSHTPPLAMLIGHSQQRMLAFAYCRGAVGRSCNHEAAEPAKEAATVVESLRELGSVIVVDDGSSTVARVCGGESCAKPFAILFAVSCGGYGQPERRPPKTCPPLADRLIAIYVKSQFSLAYETVEGPTPLRVLRHMLQSSPQGVLRSRRIAGLLYGRGAWDLQYNDTQPLDLAEAVLTDLITLTSEVSSFAAAGGTSIPRLLVQPPHANHPVSPAKPIAAPRRRWLNSCRSPFRTESYRSAMRLAAMELNEHHSSADRQWLLFDPITITRSAATSKAQGVDRDALVDASGHHYTDAVLAVSASKLRQLLLGSPVPMRRDVFTRPNQPAWKPSELCGRRALACVMPAACPRGGCPQVNRSHCAALYGPSEPAS